MGIWIKGSYAVIRGFFPAFPDFYLTDKGLGHIFLGSGSPKPGIISGITRGYVANGSSIIWQATCSHLVPGYIIPAHEFVAFSCCCRGTGCCSHHICMGIWIKGSYAVICGFFPVISVFHLTDKGLRHCFLKSRIVGGITCGRVPDRCFVCIQHSVSNRFPFRIIPAYKFISFPYCCLGTGCCSHHICMDIWIKDSYAVICGFFPVVSILHLADVGLRHCFLKSRIVGGFTCGRVAERSSLIW